jgi:hypothetical protein
MADLTITDLPIITTPSLGDVLPYNNISYLSNPSTGFTTNLNTLPYTRASGNGTDVYYGGLIYGGGKFLAIGNHVNQQGGTVGSGGQTYGGDNAFSTDNISWQTTLTTIITGLPHAKPAYGNGTYVYLTYLSPQKQYAIYSTDGISWLSAAMPCPLRGYYGPFSIYDSIIYAQNKFVATCLARNSIAYSTDGISWLSAAIPTNNQGTIQGARLAYGNNTFVAVPSMDAGYGVYSTDGITWSLGTTLIPSGNMYSLAYGSNKFVGLPQSTNNIFYSTDGISWLSAGLPAFMQGRSWVDLTYANNKFIAISDDNSYIGAYSIDGFTWYQLPLPYAPDGNGNWQGVAYGNNTFAIISDIGYTSYIINDNQFTGPTTSKITLSNAVQAAGALPSQAANYIYVPVTDNASTNGTNLLNAYATGKTLTPSTSALSSTNRVSIILPPGNYDLGSSSLTLDTQYVDLVGLTKEAGHVTITSSNGTSSIIQTANDVRCIGFTIKNTGNAGGWKPSSNLTLTYWENIIFTVDQIASNITLSGTFKNCQATNSVNNGGGFVGSYGTASGTFTNCTGSNTGNNGGGFSGYFSIASGVFTDCTGSNTGANGGGFAGQINDISGTFTNCTGSNTGQYGGGFGGYSTSLIGTFINCTGSNTGNVGGGFAGNSSNASGTFHNCTGLNSGGSGGGFVAAYYKNFINDTITGKLFNCTGSNTGTNGGGFVGIYGVIQGKLFNCTGSNTGTNGGGFVGQNGSVCGAFFNCRSTDTKLPALISGLTNTGSTIKCYVNCFDASGNLVNGSA